MPPKMKTAFQLDSPYADVPWPQISVQDQDTITALLVNLLSPIGIHRKTHHPPSKGKRKRKLAAGDGQTPHPADSIPPTPPISSQVLAGLNSVTRHLSSTSSASCPSTFLPTTSSNALSKLSPELTLIVAATDNGMGIGKDGGLPWKGLKKEMAYFARVTKRAAQEDVRNVVIMGRKTWESIPDKFRPLPDRINIVLSRSHPEKPDKWLHEYMLYGYRNGQLEVPSLESALAALQFREVGKVFVIGGAEIYNAALELPNTKRILLTRILSDFDCDTAFPISLSSSDPSSSAPLWERKEKKELDAWAGEEMPSGEQEENGTKYVYEMWEKESDKKEHMPVLFTTRHPTPPLTSYLPMLAYTASLAHLDKEPTRLVVLPPKSEARLCEALGIARAGFIGLLEGDAVGTKALVEFVREKVPKIEPGKWLEEGVKSYKETRIDAYQVPAPVLQKDKDKK